MRRPQKTWKTQLRRARGEGPFLPTMLQLLQAKPGHMLLIRSGIVESVQEVPPAVLDAIAEES